MKASIKVTIAAAVFCIGGFYLYGGDDPQPPAGLEKAAKPTATVEASDASHDSEAPTVDRAPASTYAFEESQLSHPYLLELTVHVVDEHGLPISGFTPELAPPGGTLRNAAGATDDTGTLLVRWPARQPNVTVEVLDPRRHRRSVTLRHGVPNHITFVGKHRSGIRISFSTAESVHLINDVDALVLAGSASSNNLTAGLHPHALFSERGLVPIVPPAKNTPSNNIDSTAISRLLGESFSIADFGNLTIQGGSITMDAVTAGTTVPEVEHCSIEGLVYGEDGKPKRDVPVVVIGSSPQPLHRGKTDQNGAYRFPKLLANTYQVRAGGTDLGLATVALQVDKGNYTQNLNLKREACIRGTLHDEHAKGVVKATIEWLSDDGQWADRTKTRDDGTFVIANLPSVSGSLYAWYGDSQMRFPIAHMTGIRPDSGEVAVVCELNNTGTIRVQPSSAGGRTLDQLRLRLRHVDTGFSRGIRMPQAKSQSTDAEGKTRTAFLKSPNSAWQHERLPAGFYEVEMWLAGCGTTNLGRHWVDNKADVDLGTVSLAEPGLVHFEIPSGKMPKDLKAEICALRKPFDVRMESLTTLANDVQLAAGSYVLATQRGEQTPRFETFEVHSGNKTTVRVVW